MKNYFTVICSLILLGCSGDDNITPNNTETPEKNLRYVKSIATSLQYQSFNTYFYENSKLTKMYNSSMFRRYQMTYQNNKIWRIAGEYYDWDQQNPNEFHEDFDYEILYPGTNSLGEINYQGSNIYRTIYGNESWTLNENGQPLTLQTQRDAYSGVYEYNYNADNVFVSKIRTINGQQVDYKYEFDDKINPYFVLYNKFGFFEYGYSINPEILTMDESLFPNNVTKIYKNNILIYSAIYDYDNDGYPIKRTVVDNTGESIPAYTNNVFEYKYFD